LTPLPGSEDHKALWQKGVPMDPDMNPGSFSSDHEVPSASSRSRLRALA
jgi:hypothetical protein